MPDNQVPINPHHLRIYFGYKVNGGGFLNKQNEIVPIQLHNQNQPEQMKKNSPAKLALRLKKQDGSEVLIYNGINQYILSAILKELG